MILILEKIDDQYVLFDAEAGEPRGQGRYPSEAFMNAAADARKFPGMYMDASEGKSAAAAVEKVIKALRKRPPRKKPTKRR